MTDQSVVVIILRAGKQNGDTDAFVGMVSFIGSLLKTSYTRLSHLSQGLRCLAVLLRRPDLKAVPPCKACKRRGKSAMT